MVRKNMGKKISAILLFNHETVLESYQVCTYRFDSPQRDIFRPISNEYVSRGQPLFYGIRDHVVLSVFTLYIG